MWEACFADSVIAFGSGGPQRWSIRAAGNGYGSYP